ncbi:MAG: hypothetical protein HRU07_05400 [Nitrosopumilus sp.]|nr:hypothetical protein [Nitrosopumilus sp.]NRA05582.1 hypothetical protein [Nitrosopumilus sp.]
MDDAGKVYFISYHTSGSANAFFGELDPSDDTITLWDLGKHITASTIAFDDVNNIIYAGASDDWEFYSLDVDTNEFKTWYNHPTCDSWFGGTSYIAASGLVYGNSNNWAALCTLNPSNNEVKLYQTGISFSNTQRHDVDSSGNIFVTDSSVKKIVMINPTVPEATSWTLSQGASWEIRVDQNNDPWMVSRNNAGGGSDVGLVRLDVSTNVVTEWDLDVIPEFAGHLYFPNTTTSPTGDMWAVMENWGVGSNDSIVQFCGDPCT